MNSTLWDKIQAVFWLIYLLFKHWFNMDNVQAELDQIKKDLDTRIGLTGDGFIITWDIYQTNCFWFEPKTLCKCPDGLGECTDANRCPILGRLKRV